MSSSYLSGHVLTPQGFVQGRVQFNVNGRIQAIEGEALQGSAASQSEQVRASTEPLILPGFIDLHVHGGAGRDIMEGGDAAAVVTQVHAQHGTTSLLATTMTAPNSDIDTAFAAMAPWAHAAQPAGARILGVHLEGPYINEARLGAQPPFARPIELTDILAWHKQVAIRLITLAPEVGHNLDLIPELIAMGIKVQLGHTSGSYEQGVAALRCGATGFTHLFNAMSPLHHREPGMVGAALAHAPFAEIIPDLLHVHPGAIHAALRAIPGLYCVTDSTSAAGMPDGDYKLGRHTVTKCGAGVRLPDGTLAGSVLTMDSALRNLVDVLGLDLAHAAQRVATFAADHLGLPDRGRLQTGAWADAVVLNRDLTVQSVWVEGHCVVA